MKDSEVKLIRLFVGVCYHIRPSPRHINKKLHLTSQYVLHIGPDVFVCVYSLSSG